MPKAYFSSLGYMLSLNTSTTNNIASAATIGQGLPGRRWWWRECHGPRSLGSRAGGEDAKGSYHVHKAYFEPRRFRHQDLVGYMLNQGLFRTAARLLITSNYNNQILSFITR